VHKRVNKHKLKRSAGHQGPAAVQSQISEVNWAHDLNLYKKGFNKHKCERSVDQRGPEAAKGGSAGIGPAALHNRTNKLRVMEQFSLHYIIKYQRKKLTKINKAIKVIYRTQRSFIF
jgi:hypothetical protein